MARGSAGSTRPMGLGSDRGRGRHRPGNSRVPSGRLGRLACSCAATASGGRPSAPLRGADGQPLAAAATGASDGTVVVGAGRGGVSRGRDRRCHGEKRSRDGASRSVGGGASRASLAHPARRTILVTPATGGGTLCRAPHSTSPGCPATTSLHPRRRRHAGAKPGPSASTECHSISAAALLGRASRSPAAATPAPKRAGAGGGGDVRPGCRRALLGGPSPCSGVRGHGRGRRPAR